MPLNDMTAKHKPADAVSRRHFHVAYCGSEQFSEEFEGWYALEQDGSGIGPLGDRADAVSLCAELNAAQAELQADILKAITHV